MDRAYLMAAKADAYASLNRHESAIEWTRRSIDEYRQQELGDSLAEASSKKLKMYTEKMKSRSR